MRIVFHIFFAFLVFTLAVRAEPVSVNRGAGLGYVFSHRGNCYLIVPAHVHGRQTRLSISTTTPVAAGDAALVRSYGPQLDLSLFYVASGLEQRCRDSFEQLPEELGNVLDRATTAQLVRVDATGLETRDDMAITAVDFETLSATPLGTEIYQGTSGGILRIGNTLVGMAIQSEGVDQATFLRMDEIVSRIRRLLSGGTPVLPVAAEPPPSGPAASTCPAGAIPIRAIACSIEPLSPEFGCTNLLAGAGLPTVFPPGASPRILLELDVPSPVPLGAVTIASADGEGQWAVPQQVSIETSSTTGNPRWMRFGSGDMSPLGTLTLANGARPYANRIAITLKSSWAPDLPSALFCVSAQ